jgi:hypothetical protein
VVQKLGHDEFCLPHHRQVGSCGQGVFGEMEGPGPAHHYGLAPALAFLDGLQDAVMLDDHAGDDEEIASIPTLGGDGLEGKVPEPDLPLLWKEGRHREQS